MSFDDTYLLKNSILNSITFLDIKTLWLTLSCLDLDPVTYSVTQNEELFALSASETLQDLPPDAYPLRFHTIQKYQQLDPSLLPLATLPHYQLTTFSGGGKNYQVLCFKDKIYIPTAFKNE